jgi:hypothetical protein
MKVTFFFNDPTAQEKSTAPHESTRIPEVGEYFMTSNTGSWYQVVVVAHKLPSLGTPMDVGVEVEVYAVKVERSKILKTAGYEDTP